MQVVIDNEPMWITSGNSKRDYYLYDKGDNIAIYEYNGTYSVTKTDFTVTGVWYVLAIFSVAFFMIGGVLLYLIRHYNERMTDVKGSIS